MTYICVFSSDISGKIGFYNLLLCFNFSDIQILKNLSICKIIICGNQIFNNLFNYLFCRFVFVIKK